MARIDAVVCKQRFSRIAIAGSSGAARCVAESCERARARGAHSTKLCLRARDTWHRAAPRDAPQSGLTPSLGKACTAAAAQVRCSGSASCVSLCGEAVNASSVNLHRNDLKKIRIFGGYLQLPPDDWFWQHCGKMDCLGFVKRFFL